MQANHRKMKALTGFAGAPVSGGNKWGERLISVRIPAPPRGVRLCRDNPRLTPGRLDGMVEDAKKYP
jgi:hypothetical protein